MLDLARMRRVRLSARPIGQRLWATLFLTPNYGLPPRVKIRLEGLELLPDHPVIFAMNHTDRYNYWPFQYALWRIGRGFTASWVKGKYYDNRLLGRLLGWANNIPTVSRGYLIARDFLNQTGRRPTPEEYGALRALVEREGDPSACLEEILCRPRDVLGRLFDPGQEDYPTCINSLFAAMMSCFVELNQQALELGVHLIVFPQGTRSVRLSRGHVGLAQIALHSRRTIVPVGCNGSDLLYRGNSPWARGGEVVYRLGQPLCYEELARFHPPPFEPFSLAAEAAHRELFQGLVDHVMGRINQLLDERHQFSAEQATEEAAGAERFV